MAAFRPRQALTPQATGDRDMDFRLDGPMTEEAVIALKKRLVEACGVDVDVLYELWGKGEDSDEDEEVLEEFSA
jgi:hypothetical protein